MKDMVDVDSALRASAYSGKRNKGGGGSGDKPSTELEPFDPSAHAVKEKAEAISMWIVIAFGLIVALVMRYYLMPTMEGTQQVLWLLPVLLTVVIIPLHRVAVPSKFHKLYTNGNWFRAFFLYLFTWLALSFALVNPPLADISPPHVSGAIDIEAVEGISDATLKGSTYSVQINQETIPIVLGFAVRDNVDAGNSTIFLTISKQGQEGKIVNLGGLVSEIAEAGPSEKFDSVSEWHRGLRKNTLTGDFAGPIVAPNSQDIGMAWDLCGDGCGPGEYLIQIELSEEGAPWSTGQNTWSREYRLLVSQIA